MQKQHNERQCEMDSSNNHDGWWQGDGDRGRQRQWATVVQWAAGQQSNCNGHWDGGCAMGGTMGGKQSPVDEGTKIEAMLGFWSAGEL